MKTGQQADLIRRLHCAAGHLNAVIKMAEDDQACENVLHQLNAVQAALRAAACELLVGQLHQREAAIVHSPSREQRTLELRRLQSLYSILMQKSNEYIEVYK